MAKYYTIYQDSNNLCEENRHVYNHVKMAEFSDKHLMYKWFAETIAEEEKEGRYHYAGKITEETNGFSVIVMHKKGDLEYSWYHKYYFEETEYDEKHDGKIYLVMHQYDVDGGFGDPVPKSELVGFTLNKIKALQYVEEHSNPHIYDKPYSSLWAGTLLIKEAQNISEIPDPYFGRFSDVFEEDDYDEDDEDEDE